MTKDGLDTKDGLGTTPKPDSISSSVSNPSPNPSQKDGLANKDGLAGGGTQEPKVGDRVCYAGDTKTLQKQYAGILEVYEIKGDRYTCKKPSGSLTSWIELADLQLVEVAA